MPKKPSPWDDPDFCKAMSFPKQGKKSKKSGKNKFNARKTICQREHHHRSALEAAVCDLYRLRELADEVKLLRTEVNLRLSEAKVLYIADFEFLDVRTGETFYAEAKGKDVGRWPTIKRLWRSYGFGRLEIWKGSHEDPRLVQTIVPKGVGDADR